MAEDGVLTLTFFTLALPPLEGRRRRFLPGVAAAAAAAVAFSLGGAGVEAVGLEDLPVRGCEDG